jgi:hypothetical protein
MLGLVEGVPVVVGAVERGGGSVRLIADIFKAVDVAELKK